ncbi:MAG: type II toxin-antitoxin system Phd/YefM family antitoxin [Candidatus Binataceae bacterium]
MKTANATDVKNRFGEFLDHARTEPVKVRKTGRPVAVLLSWDEYERLAALDDAWWAERAREAEKKGYLGPAAAVKAINRLMREKARSNP